MDGGSCATTSSEAAQRAVHVVSTKNSIAKVDGRHVHWVRTYTGGDRYSLVSFVRDRVHLLVRSTSGSFLAAACESV